MSDKPFIPLSELRGLYRMAQGYSANWGGDVRDKFSGYVHDEICQRTIAALQAQVASLEGTLTEVREIIKYVDDDANAWDDLERLLFGEKDMEDEADVD